MTENEQKLNMNALLAVIAMLVIAIVFLFAKLYSTNTIKEAAERDLNYYHKNYLRKEGGTALWAGSKGEWLSYDLRSFDGGHNWYVIRCEGDNVYIQGNVDNVYPGLLKNLNAWDRITERAEKRGPLSLTNEEDVAILKNAGFQIVPVGTN